LQRQYTASAFRNAELRSAPAANKVRHSGGDLVERRAEGGDTINRCCRRPRYDGPQERPASAQKRGRPWVATHGRAATVA